MSPVSTPPIWSMMSSSSPSASAGVRSSQSKCSQKWMRTVANRVPVPATRSSVVTSFPSPSNSSMGSSSTPMGTERVKGAMATPGPVGAGGGMRMGASTRRGCASSTFSRRNAWNTVVGSVVTRVSPPARVTVSTRRSSPRGVVSVAPASSTSPGTTASTVGVDPTKISSL
jgi:hypothetical protein